MRTRPSGVLVEISGILLHLERQGRRFFHQYAARPRHSMRPAALSAPRRRRGAARRGSAPKSDWRTLAKLLPYVWAVALARAGRARLPGRRQGRQHRRAAGAEEPGRRARAQARRSAQRCWSCRSRCWSPTALLRLSITLFTELREFLFYPVAARIARRISLEVFEHLHALSLRFHLERQTGGVSRDIERGTRSIQSLLDYTLYSILPTLVEITLVIVLLLGQVRRLVRGDHVRRAGALHRLHGHASPNGARRSGAR